MWKPRLRKTKGLIQVCKQSSQGCGCLYDARSHDYFPGEVILLVVVIRRRSNHPFDFAQRPLIKCLSDVKCPSAHARSVQWGSFICWAPGGRDYDMRSCKKMGKRHWVCLDLESQGLNWTLLYVKYMTLCNSVFSVYLVCKMGML